MPTLILPPRFTSDTIALWQAAVSSGWETERLAGWRPPERLRNADIAIYGEPLFAAAVAQALDRVLMQPPLDWLPRLPVIYLKRGLRLTTLSEARGLADTYFVKPAEDKLFAADVYTTGTDLPGDEILASDTAVLVAEAVQWTVEYRCFICDGAVAAMSPYWRDGRLALQEDGSWPAPDGEASEAEAFITSLLADVEVYVPPALVVDVGSITGRGWAVVEANPAWAAGLYGCDPVEVLRVLRRACTPRCE
jgi:hypothetical protein